MVSGVQFGAQVAQLSVGVTVSQDPTGPMGTFESSWGTVELCDIYHTKRSWGDMLGSEV